LNDLRFDNKIRFGICPSLVLTDGRTTEGRTDGRTAGNHNASSVYCWRQRLNELSR